MTLFARRHVVSLICCAVAMQNAAGTEAVGRQNLQNAPFLESTYLIDVQQGSYLSRTILGLRGSGFDLALGGFASVGDWYKTKWSDANVTWMTQVNENFGIIFGGGTGERGRKYTISPSLKLGVLTQTPMGKNAFLALRATTTLGGRLREKSCTADYGEIGGVQEVNCRLAASTLPPAETLKYLLNERPYHRNQVSVRLNWRF